MADYGYIMARVYTSRGEIPIKNASVIVESEDYSSILGARVTNENGKTSPIQIVTPEKSLSESSNGTSNGEIPFTSVNIRISHPAYYTVLVKNAQVFPGQTTIQNAEMIPLPQRSDYNFRLEEFNVTSQAL